MKVPLMIGAIMNDYSIENVAKHITTDPSIFKDSVGNDDGMLLEHIYALNDPDPSTMGALDCVFHARDVFKSRWPEAESKIAQHPWFAFLYAWLVIKRFDKDNPDYDRGRWPEAEKTIASHANAASRYAHEILGERWPAAEEVILRKEDSWAAWEYANNVIGGVWPEAESIILNKEPKYNEEAALYAIYCIKGRWKEAEYTIFHISNFRGVNWLKRYTDYLGMSEKELIDTNPDLERRLEPDLKRRYDREDTVIESQNSTGAGLLFENDESVEESDDDDQRPSIPADHSKVTRHDLIGGTSFYDYNSNSMFYHFNEVYYLNKIFDGIIKITVDPQKVDKKADELLYGYLKRRTKDGANFYIKDYFGPPESISRRAHITFIDSITFYDVISIPKKGYDRWNPHSFSKGKPTDLSQEEMIDELAPCMANSLAVELHQFLAHYLDRWEFASLKTSSAGWAGDTRTIDPCMFYDTRGDTDFEYEFEGLVVGDNIYDGLANYVMHIGMDDSGPIAESVEPVGFEYLKRHDQKSDTSIEVTKLDTYEIFRIFARIRNGHETRFGQDFRHFCDDKANELYEGNQEADYWDEPGFDPMN